MVGFVTTRAWSPKPRDLATNKAAPLIDRLAWPIIALGGIWWTVKDPWRLAALVSGTVLWWLGLNPLAAYGIGLAALALARLQDWWALIDPPKGGRKATGLVDLARLAFTRGREIWTWTLRQRVLARDWTKAAAAADLTDGQSVPALEQVHRTANGYAAEIACGEVGVPASALPDKAEILAASIAGCRSVQSSPGVTPGVARIEFLFGDALDEPFGLERLPLPPPGRVSVGLLSPNADPLTVSIYKHVLGVGVQGSGKSNMVHAMHASLHAAAIPHELYVCDPAGGVELFDLRESPCTVIYAGDVAGCDQVFARAALDLKTRLEAMAGSTRMLTASVETPLRVVVVDEFLMLWEMLKKGTRSPLGEYMGIARKGASTVWGLTVEPTVETMGAVRKLFRQKLVLATENRAMTEVVLGDGAEKAGAWCSQIPEDDPGVGYAAVPELRGFRKFRVPYLEPDEVALVSSGHLPESCPRVDESGIIRDWVLYAWWDVDGKCLYVGKSNNGRERAKQHMNDRTKRALHRPGVTMRLEASFDTEAEVLEAERRAIAEWGPSENILHSVGRGAA